MAEAGLGHPAFLRARGGDVPVRDRTGTAPPKLWAMRGQIFGLGLAQVTAAITALALTGAVVFGLSGPVAFIAGAGFVLSSTAVIVSVLQDRGELSSAEGQKSVTILLFEDLMIMPLLTVVALFVAPSRTAEPDGPAFWWRWPRWPCC